MQHFIFVDFENVPSVDLALVEDKPVHVTLLFGSKQTKLSTELSVQLNKYATQVAPVQVEASGRNALDMILAGYLGQAVERHPGAQFHIVSRDKDFEPLIAHLQAQGTKVSRHDSFAALPFAAPVKKAVTRPPFIPAPVPAKPPVAPKPKATVDKLTKFIAHLRNSPPSSRMKLEHTITDFFKPSLPAGGMKGIIADLVKRKILTIDPKGKVAYL